MELNFITPTNIRFAGVRMSKDRNRLTITKAIAEHLNLEKGSRVAIASTVDGNYVITDNGVYNFFSVSIPSLGNPNITVNKELDIEEGPYQFTLGFLGEDKKPYVEIMTKKDD